MIARPSTDHDIRNVFARMPDDRRRELTATAWHDSAGQLAEEIIMLRNSTPICEGGPDMNVHIHSLFGDTTVPAAIVGVLPFGPGLGGMIWAATLEWRRMALPSHRWWRQFFVPEVLGRYRRVEFTALAADKDSRRWLAGLGFTEEGIAYRQGKRGDDFVHCAWVNPDRTVGVIS